MSSHPWHKRIGYSNVVFTLFSQQLSESIRMISRATCRWSSVECSITPFQRSMRIVKSFWTTVLVAHIAALLARVANADTGVQILNISVSRREELRKVRLVMKSSGTFNIIQNELYLLKLHKIGGLLYALYKQLLRIILLWIWLAMLNLSCYQAVPPELINRFKMPKLKPW